MELFSAILYIHVIATLGLVAALSVEGLALWQFRRTSGQPASAYWLNSLPGLRPAASLCLLILFLSGGYLADRAPLWNLAWPKIVVVIIIAFGALAGISSRRVRKVLNDHTQTQTVDAEAARKLQTPFLKTSLSIRTGLVLAAVLLMTAKPDLWGSLGIVLAFVVIFWGMAALKPGTQMRPAATPDRELDRSVR